jgi:hypothetical protein
MKNYQALKLHHGFGACPFLQQRAAAVRENLFMSSSVPLALSAWLVGGYGIESFGCG